MAKKTAPEPMASHDETDAALRALRFPGTPDRLTYEDVRCHLWGARQSIARIEKAIRDNQRPELNGAREQILAVLRPFVRWLDANPAADPLLRDARAFPTSVLEEVLRERKEEARKARQVARDKRDGYLRPTTEADKAAMQAAATRLKGVPFRDTPGLKATYPRISKTKDQVVDEPVVVLDTLEDGGRLSRLANSAITILPRGWPLDFVDDAAWATALDARATEQGGAS